ncbi:MAG: hypothetical protein GY699_06935 [Desulfobacteraceae bacterium]|nr:hypothetical protein [Desulfobacteraceae bacterium]
MSKKAFIVTFSILFYVIMSSQVYADFIKLDFRIEGKTESNNTIVVHDKRTGEKVYFMDEPSISITDIVLAEYRTDKPTGYYTITRSIYDESVEYTDEVTPIIDFHLNEQGRKKLATVTSQNVGKRMGIFIHDKLITAPVIREIIDENVFSLHAAGIIGVKEAKDIVKMINKNNY